MYGYSDLSIRRIQFKIVVSGTKKCQFLALLFGTIFGRFLESYLPFDEGTHFQTGRGD
jgi:hypothetical protein